MRVITHDATIERNRRIAQYSFFFSLIALLAAFLFGNSLAGGNETIAIYFNCGVLPSLFLVILFSVRMANNWVREPLPWQAIQQALRGQHGTLYHFVFPARHVLVSPTGVYVLFPMFQDRRIVVKDDKWQIPGGVVARVLTFMRQEAVGNPPHDAKIEAAALQKLLDEKLPGTIVQVQPVIVFTHPKAFAVIEGEPSVPVVYTLADREPLLKDYLRQQKDQGRTTLTADQLEVLENPFIYA